MQKEEYTLGGEEPSSFRYLWRGGGFCHGDPPIVSFSFSQEHGSSQGEVLFSSISFEVLFIFFNHCVFFLMDV